MSHYRRSEFILWFEINIGGCVYLHIFQYGNPQTYGDEKFRSHVVSYAAEANDSFIYLFDSCIAGLARGLEIIYKAVQRVQPNCDRVSSGGEVWRIGTQLANH